MGGIEVFDQMVSYYKTKVRTRRWQTRVYFHFLNSIVVNAHILYEQCKLPVREDECYSLLSFLQSVIDGWATPQVLVQEKANGKYSKAKARVFRPGVHTPLYKNRNETRGWCKICKKHIPTYCQECDVAVCFGDGSSPNSCWTKYLTLLVAL